MTADRPRLSILHRFALSARPRWLSGGARPLRASDFDPCLRTRLLILQPTPFCNLRCDYCYLPDRDNKVQMSMDTVRMSARRLVDDGLASGPLTVVWHAGEPLAMPIAFYEEAFAILQAELSGVCELTYSIQTNGVLIDDAWCELFARHAVRVGVSIDGPESLHDAHRQTRRGHGTHRQVMRGIDRLKRHGLPFHAIAVVTARTLDEPEAFFSFFETLGADELGCNYDEVEGPHAESSISRREDGHARFLEQLLERVRSSSGSLRVRELTNAMQLIAHDLPTYRWRGAEWPENAQVLPFALVTVAWNGDFGTFSPELLGQPSEAFGDFILGNIAEHSYLESTGNARFAHQWYGIRRGVENCARSCAYYRFCGGGSPVNKYYETGSLEGVETLYCRTMVKRPFDITLAAIEAARQTGHLVEPWRTAPPDAAPPRASLSRR